MENHMILPIMALLCLMGVLGIFLGTKVEEVRIYRNCLETNKTMIYQEAVKQCKGVVR